MYKFSIIACARWETPYIAEWIRYYEVLGFDHIYLYCNDDDPRALRLEVQKVCRGRPDFVSFVHFPGQGRQRDMYLDGLERARNATEWVSFLDIDEFLVLKGCNDIASFMQQFPSDVDSVHFNWLIFGNNGFISRPAGSVQLQYTRRAKFFDVNTKHVTRIKALDPISLSKYAVPFWHCLPDPVWSHLNRVNALGDDVAPLLDDHTEAMCVYLEDIETSRALRDCAVINHYAFKSEDDFLLRVQRGVGGNFAGQSVWEERYNNGQYKDLLVRLNEVEDVYLSKFYQQRADLFHQTVKDTPSAPLRSIHLTHPLWAGNVMLGTNGRLMHEAQGSLASYYLTDEFLNVDWDQWPSDLFVFRDGRFIHQSLLATSVVNMRDPLTATVNTTRLQVRDIALRGPDIDAYVYVRPGTTDVDVFAAVFLAGEYADLPKLGHVSVILDLGANAGFSSVYFAKAFPDALIVAVEPEPDNFRQLCRNSFDYSTIRPVCAAIWHTDTVLALRTTDEAGSSLGAWGVQTVEVGRTTSSSTEAVSVSNLVQRFDILSIDLLKVDIEGAELELFQSNTRDWLAITQCVVVETHDRFKPGSDAAVTEALRDDFDELAPLGECRVFVRRREMVERAQDSVESDKEMTLDTPFPPTMDPGVYRELWPDLAKLSNSEVDGHYQRYGRDEGRRANAIATRYDFVSLVPQDASTLEIGPFFRPMLKGPNARFFDVLDQERLRERARLVGLADADVPHIDYVSPVGDLRIVQDTFDYALSSHCLEHQPDLIAHLQQVSRILNAGGRYLLLIPDKRYCFDALIAESTIADVLDAHDTARKVHTLKSVIEHRALTTHNDAGKHWKGDHGTIGEGPFRLLSAIQEYHAGNGGYIDVHAWYFTPSSAATLMLTLLEASFIDLVVERLYPTRMGDNEFWMVLRKPGGGS